MTSLNQDMALKLLRRCQTSVSRPCPLGGVSLTFSPSTTVSMTFRKRRKKNEESIEIMLRNKIIPSKENAQFLGTKIDNKLN